VREARAGFRFPGLARATRTTAFSGKTRTSVNGEQPCEPRSPQGHPLLTTARSMQCPDKNGCLSRTVIPVTEGEYLRQVARAQGDATSSRVVRGHAPLMARPHGLPRGLRAEDQSSFSTMDAITVPLLSRKLTVSIGACAWVMGWGGMGILVPKPPVEGSTGVSSSMLWPTMWTLRAD
jgi:hypothetical protein